MRRRLMLTATILLQWTPVFLSSDASLRLRVKLSPTLPTPSPSKYVGCTCVYSKLIIPSSYQSYLLILQRSIRDIAGLYSCGATLSDVENHRNSSGLHTIASKCFDAANISTIFIDDGIEFDKKQEWGWHSCFVPAVGRIIGIETLAETVINQVSK